MIYNLYFSGNLPEEIGRLTKLESLSLVSNLIVSLPASVSDLKHLKSVILR